MSDPMTAALFDNQEPGFLGIADQIDDVFFATYPCRGNEVLNCAVVHNTHGHPQENETTSWNEPASLTEILETAHNFHPTAKKILELVSNVDSDVKVHNLMKRTAMSTFVRDTTIVIGDAAHVMLPTYAAGGAVTIESAACLEILLSKVSIPIDNEFIRSRLRLFNKLRLGRCNMTMLLSNAGFAGVAAPGVEIEIRRFYDGPLPKPGSIPWCAENREFFFKYDVFKEALKLLEED
jgi:salicylate hydroxylase